MLQNTKNSEKMSDEGYDIVILEQQSSRSKRCKIIHKGNVYVVLNIDEIKQISLEIKYCNFTNN